MIIRGINLSFLFICLLTNNAVADAPKRGLYLQCGPHLIAIGTTFRDKLQNLATENLFSYDYRTLWKGKEAGGPIKLDSQGRASRNHFDLGGTMGAQSAFRLDRVSGQLTWSKRRERTPYCPPNPRPNYFSKEYQVCQSYKAWGTPETYYEVHGTYDCVTKSKSALNSIIERHNNSVRASRPKRKY